MVQYSGFSVHRDICICDSHKSLSQSRDLGELTWLCHHTIQPAVMEGDRAHVHANLANQCKLKAEIT